MLHVSGIMYMTEKQVKCIKVYAKTCSIVYNKVLSLMINTNYHGFKDPLPTTIIRQTIQVCLMPVKSFNPHALPGT